MEKHNKSKDLLSSNVPAFYVCILYAFGLFIAHQYNISIEITLLLSVCCFILSLLFNIYFQKNKVSLFFITVLFVLIGILRINTFYQFPKEKKEYFFYSTQTKAIPKNRLVEVTILSNRLLFKEKMKGIIKIPEPLDTIYTNRNYSIYLYEKKIFEQEKHFYYINKEYTYYYVGKNLRLITSNRLETIIKHHQINLKNKTNKIFKDATLASLVMGLLIGEKNELPYEVTRAFKTVGAMHILAVSGMHTALLFQVFSFLLVPIGHYKINRIVRCIILTIVLIYFCLLSNNASSIVRATIMCIVICMGTLQQKSNNSLNTLGISGLIILFIQPTQLWDIGFQLSFVAVMGILYANYLFKQFKVPKGLHWITQTLLFTFSAQLFTLPILLYYFHSFSTYFLISNLVLIPLSTFCIFLSLILLITQLIFIWPASIIEWFYFPFKFFIQISQHIAQWNYSWIEGIVISNTFLLMHSLLIIFLIINRNKTQQLITICLFISIQCGIEFFKRNEKHSIQHRKLSFTSHLITKNGQGFWIGTKPPEKSYIDYMKSKYSLYKLNIQTINPSKNYRIKYSQKTFIQKATKYPKIKYIR